VRRATRCTARTSAVWPAAVGAVCALIAAAPAAALVDSTGASIPNTSPSSISSLISTGPTTQTLLADPASPGDDGTCGGPGSPPGGALQSPLGPEEDLAATLDALAVAGSTEVGPLRSRALALLDGQNTVSDALTPTSNALYSGIPLLNVNPASSIKTVSAGGTVTVRIVRFGEHVLTDTALLNFADPDLPFRVIYRIVELGGATAGVHSPTPLLADAAGPIGGLNSTALKLGLPETNTLTKERSRFTDLLLGPGNTCGREEKTRQALRQVTVNMPPPRYVTALLDPNIREGHEAAATIRPATAALQASLAVPTTGNLSPLAPEKQIYDALAALDPANTAGLNLAAAQARPLVDAMRTKGKLPNGLAAAPGADLTIAFVNNEVYTSAKALHAPPGDPITVRVRNTDGFDHSLEALALRGGDKSFGPLAWGGFNWANLPVGAGVVPAGGFVDITLNPASDTFALWLGDPGSGPHAGSIVSVTRTPRVESFRFPQTFDLPLHGAFDQSGDIWVTMPGSDSVGRLKPSAGKLADSTFERFLIPGGIHNGQAPEPLFAPTDLAVDARGIVWVTLTAGNAIARVDPAAVSNNTTQGIRIYHLEPCPNTTVCRPPPPPAPITALSRDPLQIALHQDGEGNTVLWFTEAAADNIGVMRVTPAGTALAPDGAPLPDNLAAFDLPCGCTMPFGIALDPEGDVWFTEAITPRLGLSAPTGGAIGRLRPGQARPFAASTPTISHYPLPVPPGHAPVVDPELLIEVRPDGRRVAVPVLTVLPHSVTVDPQGRVWWTELETARVGMLDRGAAVNGTSAGISHHTIPTNEFGGLPQPADLTSDRASRIYVTDEYGDAVVAATAQGGVDASWRPSERQSLTDKPMVDDKNNLYFMEAGSGLLTRVRGVTAGSPLPAVPAVYTADTKANQVRGEGVREMTGVDVEVRRGGAVVARTTGVPVVNGAFTVGAGGTPWTLLPFDPVRVGDTVVISPQGPNAPGPFSFYAANLAVTATGPTVQGTATFAGQPVFGTVRVQGSSGAGAGNINSSTGAFSVPLPAIPNVATATVSWSRGVRGATVRTVAAFTPEPPDPPAGNAAAASAAGVVPARLVAACRSRQWIAKTGRTWSVTLFRLKGPVVRACAGKPSRILKRGKAVIWRYGRDMEVRFTKGLVDQVKVTSARFTSNRAGLKVGTRRAKLGVKSVGVRGGRRAWVNVSGGFADLRFTVKRGRVTTITATLVRSVNAKARVNARANR
jgi:streptogramin lyase